MSLENWAINKWLERLESERKGFYERGCQVKTLLLLEEGFVLLGIQPPAD
jgi:hypothetical protein